MGSVVLKGVIVKKSFSFIVLALSIASAQADFTVTGNPKEMSLTHCDAVAGSGDTVKAAGCLIGPACVNLPYTQAPDPTGPCGANAIPDPANTAGILSCALAYEISIDDAGTSVSVPSESSARFDISKNYQVLTNNDGIHIDFDNQTISVDGIGSCASH
jgi:hypothetical protein